MILVYFQKSCTGPHDQKNVSGCHWACLSNRFCGDGEIDLYDCYHTIPAQNDGILKQACTILHSQKSSVSVNIINVQRQIGSNDCGLYAFAMAFDLCNGVDPFLQNYDQSKMREHLRVCLEQKMIERFPVTSKVSRHRRRRIIEKVTTGIYCICRLPEEKPMAYCELCDTWYHKGCIEIPTEVFTDDDMAWKCGLCTFCFSMHLIKLYISCL